MSRRAEAGADVPVSPMFSILLKLLKELICTQRFFLNSALEICPLIQSLPARAVVIPACCMLTFLQTETRALPAQGSPAGQAALPHGWLQDTAGDLHSLTVFSLQEKMSSTFVQMQPGSDSRGSAQPGCASTLELDNAKFAMLGDYSKHFPPRLGLPSVCLLRGLWITSLFPILLSRLTPPLQAIT